MKNLRMRFWLLCADALVSVGKFGSRPYNWCIERASDCVDWSEP